MTLPEGTRGCEVDGDASGPAAEIEDVVGGFDVREEKAS